MSIVPVRRSPWVGNELAYFGTKIAQPAAAIVRTMWAKRDASRIGFWC